MKLSRVAMLSVVGMTVSSMSVYALTSGGRAWAHGGVDGAVGTSAARIAVGASAEASAGPLPATQNGARFVAPGTLAVEARVGHDHLPRGGDTTTFVAIEVRGVDAEPRERAPVSMALVIDESGSMAGDRMRHAVDAARGVVERLADGDIVTLLGFNTRARTLAPPTILDVSARTTLEQSLGGVAASGNTCISCGVEAAMKLLQRDGGQGRVEQVVVLSDGKANAGMRDADGFRRLGAACARAGMAVTTVGLGLDYNEKNLAAVADASHGSHHFVGDAKALPAVFESAAKSLASTVASKTAVHIELSPGVELVDVLDRSFERPAPSELVVPLGSVSRGEAKTVLLEVRVSRQELGARPVARMSVGYEDLVRASAGHTAGSLSLEVTDEARAPAALDPFVGARVERSRTSAVLDDANALIEAGRVAEAEARITARETVLREAARTATVAGIQGDKRAVDIARDYARQLSVTGRAKTSVGVTTKPAPLNGACGCSADDLTCHVRCSSKMNEADALELRR